MKRNGFVQASMAVTLIFLVAFVHFGRLHAAEPQLTETENGYYYTVQKGDTLWDLSKRFSNTPWVWPELWEENSRIIANPHLIYPGQKLKLVRAKGSHAPDSGISAQPGLDGIHYYYSLAEQYGFIRRAEVTPDGIIFKARDRGLTLISQGNIVYVKPEGNAALAKGARMTVFRTYEPMVDKASRQLIGTQHLLCGIVEILQQEPDYAIARVVKSYRSIKIGDKLMPYAERALRIPLQTSQTGIDGALLLSEEHLNMFAQQHIAFIDRGKLHGIRPGQIYSIYYRDEHTLGSRQSPKMITTPVDYGELLVLHVEDNTATVLITESEQEFTAGTRMRTPLSLN